MTNLLFALYLFIIYLYPLGIITLGFNMSLYIEDEYTPLYENNINNNIDYNNQHLNDITKINLMTQFEPDEYTNIKIYFYLILLINILFIKRIKLYYYILYIHYLYCVIYNKKTIIYNNIMIPFIFSNAITNTL
jgi:hypothetical protein